MCSFIYCILYIGLCILYFIYCIFLEASLYIVFISVSVLKTYHCNVKYFAALCVVYLVLSLPEDGRENLTVLDSLHNKCFCDP
jgi:hypothetical protein